MPKATLRKMSGPLLLGATTILASACGKDISPKSSQVKVTNGQDIAESDFPSVVLLVMVKNGQQSICSATFVNDHQVLTAGHCVEGLATEDPQLYFVERDAQGETSQVVKAERYRRNPNYSMSRNNGVNPSDLAVVTFPRATAPATTDIAAYRPDVGDSLTIVGYGNNRNYFESNGQMSGSGAGEKRRGENIIRKNDSGFLTFYGVPESQEGIAEGQWVASGSGDSGGPMFVNGELVGVTSGGGLVRSEDGSLVAVSHYVDLNSSESRQFLARALED